MRDICPIYNCIQYMCIPEFFNIILLCNLTLVTLTLYGAITLKIKNKENINIDINFCQGF